MKKPSRILRRTTPKIQKSPQVAPTPLFSIKEVAKRLGVHPDTVRKLIQSEALGALKVGNRWRISENDVQRYLKQARKESR